MFVGSCSTGVPPLWSLAGSPPRVTRPDPLNLSASSPPALYRHNELFATDTHRTVNPVALRPGRGRLMGTEHPPAGAAFMALQSLRNSDVFMSEMGSGIYPSVIHLPGTLPQSPGASSSDSCRGSPKSPRSRPSSPGDRAHANPGDRTRIDPASRPLVSSKELKFGIDRILTNITDIGSKGKSKNNEIEDIPSPEKPSGCSPRPRESGLPPLMSPCQCNALSCAFVFSPLSFGGHGGHLGQDPGLYHHHNSILPSYRPSDFPGPYSLLTSADKLMGRHHSQSQSQAQPKRKRSWSRAVFSNLQRKGLEKRFEVQKYVTKPDRRQLAAMLGLTDAQVKVWFQNRRMKWRHQEEAKRKKDTEHQTSDTPGSSSPEVDNMARDGAHEAMVGDGESEIDIDEDEGQVLFPGGGGDISDSDQETDRKQRQNRTQPKTEHHHQPKDAVTVDNYTSGFNHASLDVNSNVKPDI